MGRRGVTTDPGADLRGPGEGPILVASGLTKVYRSGSVEVPALRGIDLVLARGTFLAVMGPSGSGKTTLLNCLSGLDDIDGGSVEVDGHDVHAMADGRRTEHRARSMGFIFQSYNLIGVLSAVENTELPLLLVGMRPTEARERAADILGRVGLGDRGHHRPNELSGGEQQRVAVARALVTGPAIVWADEPTGNLDSVTATNILKLLYEVNQTGQTLVMVTHDPALAAGAQRLVRMQDGLIVADGSPAEILGAQPAW